jgi:hypothetical protein
MQHPLLHRLHLHAEAKHSGWVQLILKVLIDLLMGRELALVRTHLAEYVFKGRWLLGHGFSLHCTILGALAACCGWNLDKFLGEIARACGDATNLAWRYPGCVGTLQNGYIRNVPLPRMAPWVQSASHMMSHGAKSRTCYSQVPRVPTYSEHSRLLTGLGGISPSLFFPVGWCRPLTD